MLSVIRSNVTKSSAALALVVLVTLLGTALLVQTTSATPGSGVTPESITVVNLAQPVDAKFKEKASGFRTDTEVTNLQLIKFTVTPGGFFGWHAHGGPVWAMVASGTLTLYDADDPSCSGTDYPAGSAFLDPGIHVHNARNEGSEDVVVYATFMLPDGGAVRIDAPDPGNCPF